MHASKDGGLLPPVQSLYSHRLKVLSEKPKATGDNANRPGDKPEVNSSSSF